MGAVAAGAHGEVGPVVEQKGDVARLRHRTKQLHRMKDLVVRHVLEPELHRADVARVQRLGEQRDERLRHQRRRRHQVKAAGLRHASVRPGRRRGGCRAGTVEGGAACPASERSFRGETRAPDLADPTRAVIRRTGPGAAEPRVEPAGRTGFGEVERRRAAGQHDRAERRRALQHRAPLRTRRRQHQAALAEAERFHRAPRRVAAIQQVVAPQPGPELPPPPRPGRATTRHP